MNILMDIEKPKADVWFASGQTLPYQKNHGQILSHSTENHLDNGVLHIWNKVVGDSQPNEESQWTTMMPGFPDGAFGWAGTEPFLSQLDTDPRLYVEYIGMGASDKPHNYDYSIRERADLVEALWRYHKVKQTVLVTFDFSSLTALELLSRQIDRQGHGLEVETKITKVLFINGGLFADSHSHPIMTTPLLKTPFGRMGAKMAQYSRFAFNLMMKDLWSKEYGVTKEELSEFHTAIGKNKGTVFMSDAAGFVDEHQHNAERWDLKRIFKETYPDIKYMVAGSEKDQFEPKQVIKAQYELEPLGLRVKMFPGGHMTTSEHPNLIAETITSFKST
ncbi:alpha/beta hydrolase [Flagellimonas allohymeniacidonis]|uniref:Alpha/beta hydrolase n=1 Tax=Flagellimonas allohymeniacidonis TaxID=2517819 RepID=A0A4Q8QHL3_9FLAO|nr:alpha/beta hydrolase [Allomuricauda hymeniacidonis]TAI49434.1 alpha/beta hydrolase [Allomuricauda hymeniacidonis]